jgi:hypothetical protein
MILLVAGGMVAILGFAALAIDLGFQTHTRREAQNDADAIALAAVRELPDEDLADDVATQWAVKNDVATAEVVGGSPEYGVTCSGESIDGTTTVRLKRNQGTFFASVLGLAEAQLNVCATARTGQAMAGYGLMPLGFLDENPNLAGVCYMRETDGTERADLWGTECDVKIENPSGSWAPGNTGGLALDTNQIVEGSYNETSGYDCTGSNNGGDEYRENLINGTACPYAIGDQVTPKTGAVTGPTNQALTERLDGNTDTIEQVFGTPNEDGIYTNVDTSSPRFGVIPVIYIPPGASGTSDEFTIVEFVTVYIVDSQVSGGGSNALTTVTVIPMKSEIYVTGIEFAEGAYGETLSNPFNTIKLVE